MLLRRPSAMSRPCASPYQGATLDLTNGNLSQQYQGPTVKSAFGLTLNFWLTYNSYNADGSRAQIDSGLGYGWTHTYNIFLFNQLGNMFRMDGQGRVTKYQYQAGSGGTFVSTTGYFEILQSLGSGVFQLRQKDGTVFKFGPIPNTPFLVGGPVYRVTSSTDRNGNTTNFTYT